MLPKFFVSHLYLGNRLFVKNIKSGESENSRNLISPNTVCAVQTVNTTGSGQNHYGLAWPGKDKENTVFKSLGDHPD